MSKTQVSKGEDLLITRLDRGYLGQERTVMRVDGETGDISFFDLEGNVILSMDFETGGVSMSSPLGLLSFTTVNRPEADAVGATPEVPVMVWNSTDRKINISDGTAWYTAAGDVT